MMPTDAELRRLVVERKVKDNTQPVSQYELLCRIWNLLPIGVVSGISYYDGWHEPFEGYAIPLTDGKVRCDIEQLGKMILEPKQFNDHCYVTNVRLWG